MRVQLFSRLGLGGVFLIAGFEQLARLIQALFHRLHVGENQFEVNRLDIARRIDRAVHMDDIIILKAAHNMHDGVALADMGEELVAQALAVAGALDQARDIHKFHAGGRNLLGLVHPGQHVQTLIRHGYHAGVGFNGAERIIGGLRARIGNGVKQGAFAHIGQTNDA